MRASDRDREQALDVLRRRCAEDSLSVDTFERRVERTFAARAVSELRGLVADVAGEWLAVDAGSLDGTWLHNRRVVRTIVVPGDARWLGSCPVGLD